MEDKDIRCPLNFPNGSTGYSSLNDGITKGEEKQRMRQAAAIFFPLVLPRPRRLVLPLLFPVFAFLLRRGVPRRVTVFLARSRAGREKLLNLNHIFFLDHVGIVIPADWPPSLRSSVAASCATPEIPGEALKNTSPEELRRRDDVNRGGGSWSKESWKVFVSRGTATSEECETRIRLLLSRRGEIPSSIGHAIDRSPLLR